MFWEILYFVRAFVVGPNIDERRQVPRARCDIALSCQTKKGARICSLRDLSACGARLSTDGRWRKGTKVQLMPPKGAGVDSKKGLPAVVMWSRPVLGQYQVGIKFEQKTNGTWVGQVLEELGLSSNIPQQRRVHVRFPGNYELKYIVKGAERKGILKNLSLGGALLATKHKLTANTPIQIFLPARNQAPDLHLIGTTCGGKTAETGEFDVPIRFGMLHVDQKKGLLKHLTELMNQARTM